MGFAFAALLTGTKNNYQKAGSVNNACINDKAGDDTLEGGPGRDNVQGGTGQDVARGGDGSGDFVSVVDRQTGDFAFGGAVSETSAWVTSFHAQVMATPSTVAPAGSRSTQRHHREGAQSPRDLERVGDLSSFVLNRNLRLDSTAAASSRRVCRLLPQLWVL